MLTETSKRELLVGFPNLFLVGAPKCGTTSVARALGKHPEVYLGATKEPWFLNKDFGPRKIENEKEYIKHYQGAESQHRYLCDASTMYFYSRSARELIAKVPNSLVIIMVRDPIDMALSWYAQKRLTLEEDIEDFESAWRLIPERKAGGKVSRRLRERRWVYYDEMAELGTISEKWVETLGQDRVKILFLEDMERSPKAFFLDLFGFLGLSMHEDSIERIHKNRRRRPRSLLVAKLLSDVERLRSELIPIQTGMNLFSRLQNINRVNESKVRDISERFEMELITHFRDEVKRLERLTGKSQSFGLRTR